MLFALTFIFLSSELYSQQKYSFFAPADTFHSTRFYTLAATGTAMYTALMIGLNQAWYVDQGKSSFHLFNDWKEWKNMDKAGHWYTAYSYSRLAYQGARWTGLKDNTSLWLASGLSFLLQGSLEVLDGHSEKWGFSFPDLTFNTLGIASFFTQQKLWGAQRIIAKISSTAKDYSPDPLSSISGNQGYNLQQRSKDLFGNSFAESFLKDYNAQTVWASINIRSFLPSSKWPKWLNLAIGYSAENLYAGYGYRIKDPNSNEIYQLSSQIYPRFGQLMLSPDIDFTKIPTKSAFLKTLFQALNLFKFPAPTLEFSKFNGVKVHPFYW